MSAFRLPPELRAKGEAAETRFREWLDFSEVAYLYVEQSPFYFPDHLRDRIKRPDFVVGVPLVGALAFDVKAYTVKNDSLMFNYDEVQKLALFARMFHQTLIFACLDAATPELMKWVRLDELRMKAPEWRGKSKVITFPEVESYTFPMHMPFHEVLKLMSICAADKLEAAEL